MNKDTTKAIREALNHCKALSKITCIDISDKEANGKWFWKMKIQVEKGFEHLLNKIEPMCKNIGWLNEEGLWIKREGRWLWLS